MFAGSFEHVLDEKGRTSLPKPFREALAELDGTPWITVLPRCLQVLPAAVFDAQRDRLLQASSTSDAVQRLQRLFIGMAKPAQVDRQGRIQIPPELRQWARLERELVFTGVGDRIELWDRTLLADDLERTRHEYAQLSHEAKEYGL